MTAPLSDEMKRSNLRFSLTMPLFFMVMFPLCYITALHLPVPHHIPVGVVGAGAAGVVAALGPRFGSAVDLTPVGSVDQARDLIFQQSIKAAYVPAPPGGAAQMLVAGADGRVMTQLVPQLFSPVAAAGGSTLSTVDVAPLAAGDGNGIGLMFFMLIVCIVGFMTANILGNAAFFLPVRTRVGISAAAAVLTPVVLWLFMGLWLQILVGSFGQILAVIALGAVASFVTGLVTTAAVVVLGKWALFPCMLVFVFLNIPSSNSAYPAEIVPPFFGGLSEVHLGAALVGAVRSILYFDGVGLAGHLVTMGVWLLAGIAALAGAIAWRDHHASTSSAADPGAGDGPVLSGHVQDEDGAPLPAAVVTVVDDHGGQSGRARADDDGRFAVGDLPGGTFTVIATAPGHAPAAHTATLGGPGADLGSIRLTGRRGAHADGARPAPRPDRDGSGTSENSMSPAASHGG